MSLPGISMFYCVISAIGLIFAWMILPETEGKTLEDIELHYSDNSKNITDRKIIKTKSNHNQSDDKTIANKSKGFEAGFDNKAFESENSRV